MASKRELNQFLKHQRRLWATEHNIKWSGKSVNSAYSKGYADNRMGVKPLHPKVKSYMKGFKDAIADRK